MGVGHENKSMTDPQGPGESPPPPTIADATESVQPSPQLAGIGGVRVSRVFRWRFCWLSV